MSDQHPIVLVVDDEELIREVVVTALNRLGYRAIGRADADSAIEVLDNTPSVQVLLSDICLQSGTGPDLVRQALRRRPELKVVFMTGGFDHISFRRTDPVLGKPFDFQCLREAIDNVLTQPHPPYERRPDTLERRRLIPQATR